MLSNEIQLFEKLPTRFGCKGETNPNRAFEKFVTRLVMETLSLSGYQVLSQSTKKIWFGNNGESREIRPDIIVKSGRDVVTIIDAKCKEQLSSSDMAEIALYAKEFNIEKAVAVLPTYPGKTGMRWTSPDSGISIFEKRLDIEQVIVDLRNGYTGDITKMIQGWVGL
jgi:5-methylcytosine-specific restriction endonuclease McrBC regulatory subunit McrC